MPARLRLLFATVVIGLFAAGPAVAQTESEVTPGHTATSPMPAHSLPERLESTPRHVQQESSPVSVSVSASVSSPVSSSAASSAAKSAEPVGPRVEQARAGVQAQAVLPDAAPAPAPALMPPRAGKSVALMVVGAAAVVTGLIIGDDEGAFIAIGGLAVGLYGLYNYVK